MAPMLKRIRFAAPPASHDDFVAAMAELVAQSRTAPEATAPDRVTVATVLPPLTVPARHTAVTMEWFRDAEHAARFEAWQADTALASKVAALLGDAAAATVVATEHVVRGAPWLETRWRHGGSEVKHMALARRVAALTPREFAERWRQRAGKVGAVTIPVAARGLAYVQNHPMPRENGEWPYDAVNEVYVGDLDGLRARAEWLEHALAAGGEDDLVQANWFLALEEHVLVDRLR